MILVTIGTSTDFKFTRLLKILDELCEKNIINGEELIAQINNEEYKPKNYKYFNLVPDEEFKDLIDKSDYIITHAGTGCVVSAIKKGKKVIIFPRLYEYQEHLDNHQLELCDLFTKKGYTLSALNKEELIEAIKNIEKFEPTKFISNNEKINDLIIEFITNN